MKGCIIVILLTLLVCGLVFGLTCLSGLIFMLLWNAVLPLFGVTTLTFWQAWCLSFLLGVIGSKFSCKYSSKEDTKKCILSIERLQDILKKKKASTKEKNTSSNEDIKKSQQEVSKEETVREPIVEEEFKQETSSPKKRPHRRKKKPSTEN